MIPFEQPLSPNYNYLVFPEEVESLLPDLKGLPEVSTQLFYQYSGHQVTAITVTDPSVPRGDKQALFISRPHAHEPAGTAAILELFKALLGYGFYSGMEAEWRKEILRHHLITFVPDANPGGSCRAPVKFWDGSEIPNEKFFLWMFGESGEKAGERFPRLSEWDRREVEEPALIGIAYEQIDGNVYVEPNRDLRSTFFRSFFELDKQYSYDVWLDLHQTEFVNSAHNCTTHLATCHEEIPVNLQEKHLSLGESIHKRWREIGGIPGEKPQIPYRTNEIQRKFLSKVWLPLSSRLVHLVTEVQNNNPRTPIPQQVQLQGASILATLNWMSRAV